MLDLVLNRPLKIMKFSVQSLGGTNHCDCYNSLLFLFTLTLKPEFFLFIEKQRK